MGLVDVVAALIAAVTLLCGVMVVTSARPIHAACFLILTLCGVAGEYALMEAHLLAVLQILVYAGAVVVLIVFVLMIMGYGAADAEPLRVSWRTVTGGALAFALTALVALGVRSQPMRPPAAEIPEGYGELEAMGEALLGPYLVSFELISLVLLVAIVGAVLLLRGAGDREGGEAKR